MSSIQNIRADIIKQFLSKHNEVTIRGMYASDIVAGIKLIAKTKSYSPMSHFSNQASVKSIIENTQLYEIEEDVVGKKKTWKIMELNVPEQSSIEKSDIVHSLDECPINENSESSDLEISIMDDGAESSDAKRHKSEEFDSENIVVEEHVSQEYSEIVSGTSSTEHSSLDLSDTEKNDAENIINIDATFKYFLLKFFLLDCGKLLSKLSILISISDGISWLK